MTVAPSCFAICAAAVPTPLPTAWISTRSPAASRPRVTSASYAVKNTSGIAAPSAYERLAGSRQRFLLPHHHRLGLAAAADQPHHPVTRTASGSRRADRVHVPGVLEPGDVRRPARRRGIGAAALVDVGPVQAGRLHPDADLTRLHFGIGNVAEGDDVGSTRSGVDGGSHG